MIISPDALKMHPDHLKVAALSCAYREKIARLREQVEEVTKAAGDLPVRAEGKERKAVPPKRRAPSPPAAKEWHGPSPENRRLYKLCRFNKVDLLV